LLDAATELFATNGSRGTGIAAVAAEAGVTGATLLHHFGSKDGLLLAVLEERDKRLGGDWRHVVQPGGLEMFRRLPEIADTWIREPAVNRLHLVLMAESIDDESPGHRYFAWRQSALRRSLRRAIEAGQATGEVRADIDARTKAIEIAAFLDGIALQWQLDPERIPLREVVEAYAQTLVDALAARPETDRNKR
jgi:AcrR family transcriptional regulator